MKNKYLLMVALLLAFLPKIVFADIIMPLSIITVPAIPLIVLAEWIVFWIARKITGFDVKLYMLALAVFVANVVTSIIGTIFPLYKNAAENAILVGIAFIFSVLIEWGIYELFFRKKIGIKNLFLVSLIGNVITYGLIMAFVLG